MGRIRSIKPEFPHSESIGKLSREARLLFILLWTIADDEGKLRGASRMLASLLYPYDDDAPRLIDDWIDELEMEPHIVRYIVKGDTFIQICNWNKHQKIEKPTRSKLPAFDIDSPTPPRSLLDSSPKPLESSTTDKDKEGDKEEEKDQGLTPSSAAPTVRPPVVRPEEFANTWNRERGPLPKVEAFTESRRKKVKARIRQGITLERFQEAVACCRGKPFLRGENERGWTATFDWLIENDRNIEKAITGYSRTGAGHGSQLGESNGDRAMRVLAESLAADQARADAVRSVPAGEARHVSLGTLLGKIGAGAG